MKKIFIIFPLIIVLFSCVEDSIIELPVNNVKPELEINNLVGIKLETPFVSTDVFMNIKIDVAQVVTIKIFDISNKIVSKESITVKVGNNVLKVHTTALPSSAYRIGIFDSKNKQLGITDFNKL